MILVQRILFGLALIMAVIAIIYLVSAVYKFFTQSYEVYHSKKEITVTPFDIKLYFEEIVFKSSDGTNISGWFIPAGKRKEIVLFLHGNGGNISKRIALIDYFNRQIGLPVFIIDYRGYGKSEGTPTEEGTYLDAAAAWEYLTGSRKIKPENIIIYGRSLGGSIAAELAGKVKSRLLILDSTFTSMKDIAAETYPYLPVRKFFKFNYSTIDCLKKVSCPVLIIHSTGDDYIPFSHAVKLYNAANKPKHFLKIEGTHKNNYIKSKQVFIEGIKSFISEYRKS